MTIPQEIFIFLVMSQYFYVLFQKGLGSNPTLAMNILNTLDSYINYYVH